jgi:hypothetical protein
MGDVVQRHVHKLRDEEAPAFNVVVEPGRDNNGYRVYSDLSKVEMIYRKLLLCITLVACFLALAECLSSMALKAEGLGFAGDSTGDPLDPGQLGESMSTPLPQELIQEAQDAGVITKSNPLHNPDGKETAIPVETNSEADADSSMGNVNVTGIWSFDLYGTAPGKMKLRLVQNKDAIFGEGVVNRENRTENATAKGSISGGKIDLNVTTMGVSDLYRIDLSLSSLASGAYTASLADGSRHSGKVTFIASSNIFKDGT